MLKIEELSLEVGNRSLVLHSRQLLIGFLNILFYYFHQLMLNIFNLNQLCLLQDSLQIFDYFLKVLNIMKYLKFNLFLIAGHVLLL
jgi:hypothetical protein